MPNQVFSEIVVRIVAVLRCANRATFLLQFTCPLFSFCAQSIGNYFSRMRIMDYFVTYCAEDGEVGSNPMWHSCLLFSQTDNPEKKLEVVDTWGFYGLPNTSTTTSLLRRLQIKIGLDVDITGNHGMFRGEPYRELDTGVGLHGVTFRLTEEQFKSVRALCKDIAEAQDHAIHEIVDSQGIQGKSKAETRIYAHEQYSRLIYALELIKAHQAGKEPRLKLFELRFSVGLDGIGFHKASTCKSEALAVLATVLPAEQIDRLTEHGRHLTIPRFSGPMEHFSLYSEGPLRPHAKASGKVVYYRDGTDPGVKLFWTLPPQMLVPNTDEHLQCFKIDDRYSHGLKSIVKRLQQMEWLFRNAEVPAYLTHYKDVLIDHLVAEYKSFYALRPSSVRAPVNWLSRFSLKHEVMDPESQNKVHHARMLLHSLYMAAVDNWTIVDQRPTDSSRHNNAIEAIAGYLSENDKMSLCKILGHSYCKHEEAAEPTFEEETRFAMN